MEPNIWKMNLNQLIQEQRKLAQRTMDVNEAIAQKMGQSNGGPPNVPKKALPSPRMPRWSPRDWVPQWGMYSGGKGPDGANDDSAVVAKGTANHALFASADKPLSTRDRVIEALKEKVYNVEDLYKTEGWAQALARSQNFQNLTLLVIALNTIWMAVETDYNKAVVLCQASMIFQVVDNLFTLYFGFEIITRFLSFVNKRDAFRDGWFCFDSFLVLLMVWETYIVVIVFLMIGGISSGGLKKLVIFRLFRLLRLTRVARLARLLRAFPELLVLAKAMIMAFRSLGATLTLLSLTIYVFSILFTQLLDSSPTGKGYFETIPMTFDTLLMFCAFAEQREMFEHMLEGGLVYYILFMIYMLVGSYTVLTMLIGVICEVIADVANREREDILIQDLRYKMAQISERFDQSEGDEEKMVTRDCFDHLMDNEEAARMLNEVGVDVVGLVELSEFVFPDGDKIPLSKFTQLILQFRGSNTATVKDIVDMRKYVLEKLREMETRMDVRQPLPAIPEMSSGRPAGGKMAKANSTPAATSKTPLLKKNTTDSGNSDQKAFAAQPTTLFADAGQAGNTRDRVVQALKENPYNVEDLYWEEGRAQALARNDSFSNLTLLVIALNTIWMAVETDYNKAVVLCEAPMIFQIVDNLFTLYFMFEIFCRYCAFKNKRDAWADGWFKFDSFLVLLMVWETYIVVALFLIAGGGSGGGLKKLTIFRLFRLLRLTRVARLARLLRAFPELLVLAKAMIMALRSLGATLSLLCIVIYVFAILFTQLLSETEIGKGYFETIPMTFDTLLMFGVFTEQREFFPHMMEGGLIYYFLFMIYILVGSYTVLNMLIGVICEVIADVANTERESILIDELRFKLGQLSSMFQKQPGQDEVQVSRSAFEELVNNEEGARMLNECGVDVVGLVELSEFVFPSQESDSIDLSKFMQLILQFRGSNTATVKDIVDMRKYVLGEIRELENRMSMTM